MPELPEVETIARGLREPLTGARVTALEVPGPHCLPQGVDTFRQRVLGATFTGVGRRGKLLLAELAAPEHGPLLLAVHLRMTGRFFLPAPGDTDADLATDKHTHLRLHLAGHPRPLLFHDVRKFGLVQALTPGELAELPFYRGLGPEPLELDAPGFLRCFRNTHGTANRKGRIKSLLLDQRILAGVGNIYADEALFRAGLRPDTPAERIPDSRLVLLHASLQAVLREAIAACGSSIRDYRTAQGSAGAFQKCFRVYGRGGQPCLSCGTPLQRGTVAGRGSVWCPACQPELTA